MALTTNKRNKIIADWKAGRFKSFYAIAKHYEISQPTAKEILGDIPQSNADIVEVGIAYENAKKVTKNLVELKAIEATVRERTIADDIKDIAMETTLVNLRSVKKKLELEEVETMQEHRHAQETIDKALISSGNADRHAKSGDVNVNTTAAVQNTTTVLTKEDAHRQYLEFING